MSPGCQRCRARRRSCHYDSSAIANSGGTYVDVPPAGNKPIAADGPGSLVGDQDMDFEAADSITPYTLVGEGPFLYTTSEAVDDFSTDNMNCFFGESMSSRSSVTPIDDAKVKPCLS